MTTSGEEVSPTGTSAAGNGAAVPPTPRIAVVFSGGGARAAYQVGLLRGLARLCPQLRFPIVTGTSAGGINAAFLAGHHGTPTEALRDLVDLWSLLTFERVFRTEGSALAGNVMRWGTRLLSGGNPAAPHVRGLLDTAPLRELLASAMTTVNGEIVGVGENLERGRLEAAALSTISYTTGQTVAWVQGRDFEAWERPNRRAVRARLSVEHVMASAALPLLFPAVRIGSHYYGDGGVRMTAPFAPAIHLGADAILAISTQYARSLDEAERPLIQGYPPPAQVLGTIVNALFLDVLDQDSLTLRRINRLVEALPPERRQGLRPVALEVLRPSEDLGRLAAGFERRIPKGLRFLTRGLGTRETASPDVLSLLMFEPEYLTRLIELGERDAAAAAPRVTRLGGPDAVSPAGVPTPQVADGAAAGASAGD